MALTEGRYHGQLEQLKELQIQHFVLLVRKKPAQGEHAKPGTNIISSGQPS